MSKDSINELNAYNLAILGALDDFYDVYCTIEFAFEEMINEYFKTNTYRNLTIIDELNSYTRKIAKKLCEPLFNKYTHLFTDHSGKLHANAYGFQSFRFTYINTDVYLRIQIKHISFSMFLNQLQNIIALILHKRIVHEKFYYKIEDSYSDINNRIKSIVSNRTASLLNTNNSHIFTTNEILYIFQTLSSTSCYKNNHPVVPSRFIADFSDGSGKIMLPVHFCYHCQKYFIGKITLSLFEKRFGKFIVQKRRYEEAENSFDNYRLESKLHELGYNVINGEMSDNERQNLLIFLLEHDRISYLEMSSTIEQNITLFRNSYRHQLAVLKWERDLKFIGEHVMKKKEKPINS